MTALLDERFVEWENKSDLRAQARPGYYIERDRVVPILVRWLENHLSDHPECVGRNWGKLPTASLSNMTGVPDRQIRRILQSVPKIREKLNGPRSKSRSTQIEGGEKYLTLDMVDRLFTGMGLVYLFYMSPEEGGFADVYFHESIVGKQEAVAA